MWGDVRVREAEEVISDFCWKVYFTWARFTDVGVNETSPEHENIGAFVRQWRKRATRMAIDHLGVVLAIPGGIHGEFEILEAMVL